IERYIAVSDHVQRWLIEEMYAHPEKVRVVKNGVVSSSGRVPNARLRREIANEWQGPIVLSSGRLHQEKGFVDLLHAARFVPEALFILAGDGPERAKLEEFVDRNGLKDRVRLLGHREDVPELLALCDLFVLPSLHEALGLSVLEAMSAGKPVIAT